MIRCEEKVLSDTICQGNESGPANGMLFKFITNRIQNLLLYVSNHKTQVHYFVDFRLAIQGGSWFKMLVIFLVELIRTAYPTLSRGINKHYNPDLPAAFQTISLES